MSGINKIVLLGNVCSVPELILSEPPACHFELEITEEITKGESKTELVEVHKIVLLRPLAEVASKRICINHLLFIEGKIKTDSYTDASGVRRYKTYVIALRFEIIT
jgi:single-strand DNA-binding protein